MRKLWIYWALLHILLFNLCNNVIKKYTPSLNSYFYKNDTLKYNRKRKKDNFQHPHYIYNIYDYVTKKKNLLKNCTHHFGKTYYHNNDILKKIKYEQFRKFRSVRQKLFYFSNTICMNGHNKYGLLKNGIKRKREHSTMPISLSFSDENEYHTGINKKNESFSNDDITNEEDENNFNEVNTSYPDQSNEQNFNQAIKKTEDYIKGKEDNIIEEREMIKKKKVIENLKAQENVFSDKPLDLSMHDILKHIYKNGVYISSKVLVNDICAWMKDAYVNFLKSKREALKKEHNELDKQENEITTDATKTINNSNENKVVDNDISNDLDNEKKDSYNFIFDKNDDEKLGTYVESLKLYNKKNLSKYFFSFNRGNILKQLVTEGEDDILDEEKEKEGIKKKKIDNKNDKKNELATQDKNNAIFDDHVQTILSNPMLKEDEDYYIDKHRYMKSNVTIEFNIYDTYNDKIILNNKNTNSTMIEFPLLYSHSIIQKCILTMKKLEKSIFYINNNLLFRNFTSNDQPVSDHDKSVYDVILNENWIKIEMHLCNIYGMDEKWMGISPNSFSDEQQTKSFLSEYSIGSSNNLIGSPAIPKMDPIPMGDNSKPSFENEKNQANKINNEIDKKTDNPINDNNKMSKLDEDLKANNQNKGEISERQKEILKRREEHETKKELEIKSDFLMKKLENEMKYDPEHYMWKDLYPQLDEHHKKRTDKYFDDLKKEMSENKYSRGYTDNIKKKQTLKGYDLGEEIEGRTKYYFWKENIHSFSLYFLLRLHVKKTDILIDIDNHFFSLSIYGHTIIKDMFNNPINSTDSVWTLTDNEEALTLSKNENSNENMEFPVYEITYIDDQDIKKFIKKKYCLIYNIYKDNNHKYMWGSIFKTS